MSVNDMFRRFFGFHDNRFPNEDWSPGIDHDPDAYADENVPNLFHEPEEVFRHFEQHFNEVFRSFGFMEFSTPSIQFGSEPMPRLPAQKDVPLRDKLLKQPDTRTGEGRSLIPEPHSPAQRAPLFGRLFGHRNSGSEQSQDQDLDSLVSSQGLDAALQDSSPSPNWNNSHYSNFSSSSVIIRGADGKIEKRCTKKDHLGNEETSVVRQYGDRVHSYTTRRHKDGIKEQEENFVNMDEADRDKFQRDWNTDKTSTAPNTVLGPFNSEDPSAPGMFYRLFKDILP